MVFRDTAPGLVDSEADGGKGGLNGMGGAKMRPMLSREVEEGEQDIAVFDQMNWLAIRDTEQKEAISAALHP